MTCRATPDIDVSAEAVAEHVAWLRRTKGLWAKAADECADALEIVAAERDNLRQTIQYSSTTLNFERRHREAFNLLCRIAAHGTARTIQQNCVERYMALLKKRAILALTQNET